MPTNFSLYGPTPSAAAAQQMPWTGLFTDQNNLNERARAAAVLQSIQLQEAQDRADEQARQFDQSRALRFADMNREAQERAALLDDRRALRSEDMRRFNIELGLKRDADVEGKHRFDVEADIKREGLKVRREGYELPLTPAEKIETQIETLNAQTASVQAKQIADALTVKRQVNRMANLTPDERRAAMALDPDTASLIARSVADKIGKPDPTIRWDEDSFAWTDKPVTIPGFSLGNRHEEMPRRSVAPPSFRMPSLAPGTRYDIPGVNFQNFSPSPRVGIDLGDLDADRTVDARTPSAVIPSAPASPFREGQRVFNKRTGTYFIIRNGQPVPE